MVTYEVNDYTNSVNIISYSTSVDDLPSGYGYYTYMGPSIMEPSSEFDFVFGTETIRVYSTAGCNYYAHLEVMVYKTGECKFIYDFI